MKISIIRILSLSVFLSVILLAAGCKKKTAAATTTFTLPTVTTNSIIVNLTSTTAQSGGVITSPADGITLNGVCYSSTNKTPTIADSKTIDTAGTNESTTVFTNYTSNLTGLIPNTIYYLRAYATNPVGTGYGAVIQFTTSPDLTSVGAVVSTFAGNGTAGYTEGTGTGATFNNPQGVAVDASNNVYAVDSYNNVIRMITPGGTTSTFAGTQGLGYTDGPAATASFYAPTGATFDTQGNLYIADLGNNVIRKITPAGVVSTYAGDGSAGYLDATKATSARFNAPSGLAFDASGNMYVADRGNNMIRKITPAGVVTTFAGNKTAGLLDATGNLAYFKSPNSVVVDASGNVYVADLSNYAIRKITSAGVVTTIVGGHTQTTLVNLPACLAIDKTGNIFIADEGGRILEFTTNNSLYVLAGGLNLAGFTNGAGNQALFNKPQGIAVDANGVVYVADQNNNCIRTIVVTKVL